MKIRIISWNMNVRARGDQWRLLQSLAPDIALLQEWRKPQNFQTDGYLHSEEYLSGRHTALWSKWPLQNKGHFPQNADIAWQPYEAALEGCFVSSSVQTPVGPLSMASIYAYPVALEPHQYEGFDADALRLPSAKKIWPADLIWWALKDWANVAEGTVLGGDWDTSRTLDEPKARGNQEFFERMQTCGWTEIARKFYPDESGVTTWYRKNARPMQLDHFFISPDMASSAISFGVVRTNEFDRASDHFPICLDLEIG